MTRVEIVLVVIAGLLLVLALLKLFEALALMAFQDLIDRTAADFAGWRMELDELNEMRREPKEKPPDADPQAHADDAHKAPMVRRAAERLYRRRVEG